jgi:simple sugar transport system permease protein
MGALGAVVVGYGVGGLPIWWHLPLALTVGALGGALWGAIPGILKARCGAHEVINTIMMNYIAIKLVDYLVKQVLRDPTASMDRTPSILPTALASPLWSDHSPARGSPHRPRSGRPRRLAAR